jgi:two-component system, NarL family, sensor histidine kinase UhpB
MHGITSASERAAMRSGMRRGLLLRISALLDKERSVAAYFAVFAMAILIPVLAIVGGLEYRNAAAERTQIERASQQAAHDIAFEIDHKVMIRESLLKALAGSQLLLSGDLEGFYRQAAEIADQLHGRIVLRDPFSDSHLINTGLPWDGGLPYRHPVAADERDQALRSGQPAVSDVFFGTHLQRYVVLVTAPVTQDGNLRYFLSLAIDLNGNEFTNLPDRARLRPDQIATIIDRKGTIVARSRNNEAFIGKTVGAGYWSIAGETAGTAEGSTLEGARVNFYYERSTLAGWHVTVSVPMQALEAPWIRALRSVGIAGLWLLVVGGALAYAIWSRISRAIGALRSAALALRQHERIAPANTALRETNEVAHAISAASAELRRSDEHLDLAVEAADLGTWSWNVSTGELVASDRAKMIFGIPLSSDCTRAAFLRRIHPADRQTADGAMHRCLTSREGYDVEYRIVDPGDSSVRWIGSKGRAELDDSGKPVLVNGVFQDITARKTAEAAQHELRHRLMQAQDDERLRLARDLHDRTGQSLTAVMLELKAVEAEVAASGRNRLRRLRQELDQMSHTLHRVAWELRPGSIDELGMRAALDDYTTEWSARSGIATDFHCAADDLIGLSNEVRTTIYRVVQEALTNVAKHARGATSVSIIVNRFDALLQLTIEDDGCGFDQSAKRGDSPLGGLGLAGMRERLSLIGGELAIESSPGAGTTIFVRIKLLAEVTA